MAGATGIRDEVRELARGILGAEELAAADQLAELLGGSEGDRRAAVERLQASIGTSPKRPVYYLSNEIDELPEHTRHVVRYAGDYVDQLVKCCAHERGSPSPFRLFSLRSSLGTNLRHLGKALPEKLLANLTRFNDVIYVPAKHEWDVPEDRPHLFSPAEAVVACLMMKSLAAQIISLSAEARLYSTNQRHPHYDRSQH